MDTKVSKASPKYVKLNVKIPKGFKKNKHADIKYEKDIDSFDNYISFLLIRPEKTARPSCLKMEKHTKKLT